MSETVKTAVNADGLRDLLKDHRMFHSEFQMDFFITMSNGTTPYGMYMQALRELSSRRDALRELYLKAEELKADERDATTMQDMEGSQKIRKVVALARVGYEKEKLQEAIKDTEREFRRFLGQAVLLKKHLGPLTDDKRAELDREMWMHKIKSMAAVDFLSCARLQPQTVKIMEALPVDMRAQLRGALKMNQTLIGEWEQHDPMKDIGDAPQIELNVQKLIEG